ncbi:MAG TPA: hypothetical protein VMH88_08175 [Gemmatimonadales bacterium]|nr:hypothetical protein [Gemmatimonadales bacterium]
MTSRPVVFSYIGGVISRALLPLIWFAPGAMLAQAASQPALSATTRVEYRGFSPGISYRDLLVRAQALAQPGASPMVCNTSRHTAQLIECGGPIHDPADGARFYLSAHVIAGRVDFLSFGDSGTAALVQLRQQELTRRYGTPHRSKNGLWEWGGPTRVVRFAWRGSGEARWIYVSLWDASLMKGIQPYLAAPSSTQAAPATRSP